MYNFVVNIANQAYEMVPVDALKTHPRNPRRGDVGVIAESVRTNGFFGAVIAQQSTGYILAGNHRYLAAVQEHAAEVPVIWVDADDEQALRILLADNRTSDLAHYDDTTLAEMLTELAESSLGLTGTGYTMSDIDHLIAEVERESEENSASGNGNAVDTPPLTVTVQVRASEHLVEATRLIAALAVQHPEWRATVV